MEVRKEPLTANPSPFVLDSEKATLNIIDKGLYIFSSELPTACKVTEVLFHKLLYICACFQFYKEHSSETSLSIHRQLSVTGNIKAGLGVLSFALVTLVALLKWATGSNRLRLEQNELITLFTFWNIRAIFSLWKINMLFCQKTSELHEKPKHFCALLKRATRAIRYGTFFKIAKRAISSFKNSEYDMV